MKRISFLIVAFLLISCEKDEGLVFKDQGREVPVFDAERAYSFVEDQVNFGPRYPNSDGHIQVQNYLISFLKDKAGDNFMFSQDFEATGYDESLKLRNIIASFNPYAADRIMLAAHYDTRPRSDEDIPPTDEPILGADDGGSGVAILMELATIFQNNPPPIGVDIAFFDGEDYGTSGDLDNYFLGSRYWANNPPVPGYKPRFGILLDMVGAENATFPKETYSMTYAPNLVNELWSIAAEKGYDNYFLNEEGAGAVDDHVIINRVLKIPFIDIINHRRKINGGTQFGSHWHTQGDNLDIISTETMQAVGDVLNELIYNRL